MKYNAILNLDDLNTWKMIYCNPIEILVENKVVELQYKILHRIVGTNKLLYKMGKRTSPNCDNCSMYPETIEHLFYECINVKKFWFKFFDKFYEREHIRINITCKDILLYINFEKESTNVLVNILILYGKLYLYKCKMEKVNPDIHMYAKYVAFKLAAICQVTHRYKNEYAQLNEFVNSLL